MLERHNNHHYNVPNAVGCQEVSSLRLCEPYLQIHKKGHIRFHPLFLQPSTQAALLHQQSVGKAARAFVSQPSPVVGSLPEGGVQHPPHAGGTSPVPAKPVLSAGTAQSQGLSRGLLNFTPPKLLSHWYL